LVGVIAVGIGVYYKVNKDNKAIIAYAANSAILSLLLYNKSSKFFVPNWLKNSLAGYMALLIILCLLSLSKHSSQNKTYFDDTPQKVQYRYIKELAGKFLLSSHRN
jgi:hypothetical protein